VIHAFIAPAVACFAISAVPSTGLRLSAIPEEVPEQMERRFAPLAAYLQEALGTPVVFTPVPDYAAAVERFARHEIDIVYYGGFTFVQARRRTSNALPLVQREGDAEFRTHFITAAKSSIRTLDDLRGKALAFGSISSTSGHLMPRFHLQRAGIRPEKDLREVTYSGSHDRTAEWVEAGRVDAGAINASIWDKLVEEKRIDPRKVRIFYTTPPYFDYNFTVRGDLAPELIERIEKAFLALDYDDPRHRPILDLQRTKRFIETKPENYDGIAEAARAAGLIRE
jgi:phosphonate transport system substrate-binding protein